LLIHFSGKKLVHGELWTTAIWIMIIYELPSKRAMGLAIGS